MSRLTYFIKAVTCIAYVRHKVEVLLGGVVDAIHLGDGLETFVSHEGGHVRVGSRQQRGGRGGAHTLQVGQCRDGLLDVGHLAERFLCLLHHGTRCVHLHQIRQLRVELASLQTHNINKLVIS